MQERNKQSVIAGGVLIALAFIIGFADMRIMVSAIALQEQVSFLGANRLYYFAFAFFVTGALMVSRGVRNERHRYTLDA